MLSISDGDLNNLLTSISCEEQLKSAGFKIKVKFKQKINYSKLRGYRSRAEYFRMVSKQKTECSINYFETKKFPKKRCRLLSLN